MASQQCEAICASKCDRRLLFQIVTEELFHFVVGDYAGLVVVEVHVTDSRDYHYLLVADCHTLAVAFFSGHLLEGAFAEVAAVGFLAVDEEHRVLDFGSHTQQGLVDERHRARNIPATN